MNVEVRIHEYAGVNSVVLEWGVGKRGGFVTGSNDCILGGGLFVGGSGGVGFLRACALSTEGGHGGIGS